MHVAASHVLYKEPVQLETLAIVRYLMSVRIDLRPRACVERNHPQWATELPAIEDGAGNRHVGLRACVAFYESASGVEGLVAKSAGFGDAAEGAERFPGGKAWPRHATCSMEEATMMD